MPPSKRPKPESDIQPDCTSDDRDFMVDVTLIDEMIRLSPEERLLLNDRMVATILELRDAFQSK